MVELHIYFSSIHPQRWQELLFLYFVYSIRVDTNLGFVFVQIFCITNLYGFWRLDISFFVKCKGVCFHYLKQFILIEVQQAWNFVPSTTKPKCKLSLTMNDVKYFFYFEFNSFQPWGTSKFAYAFVRYHTQRSWWITFYRITSSINPTSDPQIHFSVVVMTVHCWSRSCTWLMLTHKHNDYVVFMLSTLKVQLMHCVFTVTQIE